MVSLICKNCGAPLKRKKDGGYICEYCDSEIAVENKPSENHEYTVVAGVLTKYSGTSANIVIPSTVKSIGQSCFSNLYHIESVSIPESVTKICKSAFENCKGLKTVSFTDNLLEIEEAAFKNTGLLTVELPDSLKAIGRDAFMQCENLQSATLPSSSCIVFERTFKLCKELKNVNCNMDCFCKSFKSSKETMKNGDKRSTIFDAFQATPFYDELRNTVLTNRCIKCGGSIEKGGVCENCGEKYTDYSGGCYIATAVYGTYDCPQVWTLRRYRDYVLSKSFMGMATIYLYYKISPLLVRWFGNANWFRAIWKKVLDVKIDKLNAIGYVSTPYNDIPE